MKTFKIILGCIVVMLLGTLVYLQVKPLVTPSDRPPTEIAVDTAQVDSMSSMLVFTDYHDVTSYQTKVIETFIEDSVFRCIDINIVQDISYMLIKDKGYTTVSDIVHEYIEHQDIYDSRSKRVYTAKETDTYLPDTIPRKDNTTDRVAYLRDSLPTSKTK